MPPTPISNFLPARRIALVFQAPGQRGEIGAGGEIDLRALGGEVYARVEDAGGAFQRLFDMGDAGAAGHAVDFEGAGGVFFLQVHLAQYGVREAKRHGAQARRVADPFAAARLRVRVERNVGDDGRAVGAGLEAVFRPLRGEAADGDQRQRADLFAPEGDLFKALRRPGHLFQDGREDRAERDVIRLGGEGLLQFGLVMGGDAQFQPARLDGGEVGAGEIFLSEVDEIASQLQREAPMVVDDQLRPMGLAEVAGLGDLCGQVRRLLHPQLREFHAAGQQAAQPSHMIDDEIERVQLHVKARPSTGVEGSAMSRGSMGSALNAVRPASQASAKARAMAAGSPARAIAVLSSTAS